MSMEFGHEVDQGFKDTSNNTSGADIPDLRIEPDKPKASEERVKEPAVSEASLPSADDIQRDYREIKEPGQGAPELREMAHIEGQPLIVEY